MSASTAPDVNGLINLLNALAIDFECGDKHDAKETCDKAAAALRTLLERNKELERERGQLLDKLHCMCGSPIDHSAWEGHTPVSVYDYSLDQERARAEAAEARVQELEAENARLRERQAEADRVIDMVEEDPALARSLARAYRDKGRE